MSEQESLREWLVSLKEGFSGELEKLNLKYEDYTDEAYWLEQAQDRFSETIDKLDKIIQEIELGIRLNASIDAEPFNSIRYHQKKILFMLRGKEQHNKAN